MTNAAITCPRCGVQVEPSHTRCPNCALPLRPPPPPASLRDDVRAWGIAAHLGGLGIGLTTGGFLGFVAPLFVWLLKRDEDGFVEHHAREALNFQLTVLLAVTAALALSVPAVIVGVLTLGVGLVVLGVLAAVAAVAWFVLPIVATMKAANGEGYRYPVTIRFVR